MRAQLVGMGLEGGSRAIMQNKRFSTENGTFYYEIQDKKVIITGYEGIMTRISLPSQMEGAPVAVIGSKAFLSQKSLYAVSLPDTIEEIGDWAFANCTNLTEISVPGREVRFGRAVFKNCGNLKRIITRQAHKNCSADIRCDAAPGLYFENGIGTEQNFKARQCREERCSCEPELLAAAVTMLDAYYLLDLTMAGTRDWLGRWDTRLASFLGASDQEGYISQSVYGEEDYIGTDLDEYISEKRKEKVRLSFLRLLHPRSLDPMLRVRMEDYLRSLTKGCQEEESWQVLRKEHGGDRAYYTLFAELGCITEENREGILADIGEDFPEMKAYFLTWDSRGEEKDFFTDLEL